MLELCQAEDLPWKMRQVGNVSFWDCTAECCYKLRVIQQNPSACKSASVQANVSCDREVNKLIIKEGSVACEGGEL